MPLPRTLPPPSTVALWASVALLLVAAVAGPFIGDLVSLRSGQIVLGLVLAIAWWRNRTALATPLPRTGLIAFAGAAWVWCLCCAATHFFAFRISGVDFSIFEWMVGRFGYTRIYDLNHFGVHPTFVLLPLMPVYALFHSPWVLLVAGASLIWAGLFPLLRLVRWANGAPHGALELVVMLAWLGNPWLGDLLNVGFRIESFLPVLTLWFLVGWVENRRWVWLVAMLGLWFTKEDACLFLATFALGAALTERARWRSSLFIAVGSLTWLLVYTRWVQPTLLGHPPSYTAFWSDFGSSLPEVAIGIVRHPLLALERLASSRWWALLLPALLIPLRSLRAMAGMAATLLLLGLASRQPMRDFAMYYPAPLVAFMFFGALEVWRTHRTWAFLSLLTVPLFFGGYGRSVAIDAPRLEALEAVKASVVSDTHLCVQDILFAHFGLDDRLLNLADPEVCFNNPDVTVIVNGELNTDPTPRDEFERWLEGWVTARETTSFAGGFKVLRARKTQQPPGP